MKIKMTFTIEEKGLYAGLVYDVPDEEAKAYIDSHQAIPVEEETLKKVSKK